MALRSGRPKAAHEPAAVEYAGQGPRAEARGRLLERTSRRVALTDAGRAFLARARTILGAVKEAREVARGTEQGTQGRFEVGFIS